MKTKHYLLSSLMCVLLSTALLSCGDETPSTSNNLSSNSESSALLSSEDSFIESSENKESSESSLSEDNPDVHYTTCAEAIEIATAAGETITAEKYLVKGIVQSVSNPTYGEMTIQDETGSLYVYGVYSADGQTRYDAFEDKPVAGDEIVLLGALKTYKGKPEMDRGYMQSFKHIAPEVDLSQYTSATIAQSRDAQANDKLIVNGVVSFITYANGMKPNGFYLTDNEASIYVYDNQIAAQVSIGNSVSIAATKTYYVLEDEKKNAEKWGYKGCCQLSNVTLLDNAKDNAAINLSWTQETTIKDILDTPVSENITTNIYKVNSLVRRAPGDGFTNYYFNDLDGRTGSYTYTSNNGSDFEYLDQYDGKICTVYLSPINCKATGTKCLYRFVPIKVEDNNFTFDTSKAPEFALNYYAKQQFVNKYAFDPSLEVLTSVSSELLGFENVTLTYETSNSDVAYFANNVFHINHDGTATVTITASYESYVAKTTLTVEVQAVTVEYSGVKAAVEADDGVEVVVRGVVTSSVVNQDSSFYLSDEEGLIVVKLDNSAELSTISLGDEVIVKGTRNHIIKEGYNVAGQSVIEGATIIANAYGNHQYSTSSFVEIDFADIISMTNNTNVDYTACGYITTARVVKVASQYYTNYYLSLPDNTNSNVLLYAANGKQYSFLDEFLDKTITVEVAFCNWNSKGYRLCVIAVVTEDGKIINSLNFN